MKTLAAVMVTVLAREVPGLADDPKYEAWRTDIDALAAIDDKTGAPGALVSPEVDPVVLASIQFFEGRYKAAPKDGDPRYTSVGGGRYEVLGSVVGPMQLGKTTAGWMKAHDAWWTGVTVTMLRDPETNVRGGYSILRFWKDQCGGLPGVAITAFGWGKCPPKRADLAAGRYIDWEGKRRCKLLVWMLRETGRLPDGFRCGHEASAPPRVAKEADPALDGAAEELARDE